VLGQSLDQVAASAGMKLVMISNRGVKVYPGGFADTFTVDSWRCRFMNDGNVISHQQILNLLGKVAEAGYDFQKTENLCNYDGERGYSLGQGQ
jgi:isocitrate dehydrogenase